MPASVQPGEQKMFDPAKILYSGDEKNIVFSILSFIPIHLIFYLIIYSNIILDVLLSFSANTTAFIAWPHSEWIIFHALLPFVLHHRSLQKQIILFIFSHILLEMKTFQIGKYRISKMETLPLNFWWHRRPIFFSYWTVSEVDHWPALAFLSEGNIRTLTTKIDNN